MRAKRASLALLILLVLLAIAWSGWWWWLSGRVRDQADLFLAQQRDAGWKIDTGQASLGGFPLDVRLTWPTPSVTDPQQNAWQGPATTLVVPPWRPDLPRLEAPGHHVVTLAHQPPFPLDAAQATAALSLAQAGPTRVKLALRGVAAAGAALDRLDATLHRLANAPVDHTRPSLTLDATFGDLTLAAPPAPWLSKVFAIGQVSARLMGTLDGISRAQADAWRQAGGTIEIDRFALVWAPVNLSGTATLALDPKLQLLMSGTAKVAGAPALIQSMAKAGALTPSQATLLGMGVMAMAGPDPSGTVTLPISIQDQVLGIGPIALMTLPQIQW